MLATILFNRSSLAGVWLQMLIVGFIIKFKSLNGLLVTMFTCRSVIHSKGSMVRLGNQIFFI